MKITDYELIHVKPRWLFLKVYTDEGIIGYGEPILEGKARTVATAVREFFEYLKGKDPRRIEYHWQAMYRWSFYRGGPIIMSAISGIEQALWDILGKYLNQPVYQLLGGAVRDKIKIYAHVGGNTREECAQNALKRIREGFRALKMAPFGAMRIVDTPKKVKEAVEKVRAVREAVGEDVDLGIDCHGRLSPSMAILAAKALEPYSPMFLEEPCLPENVDTMVTIARSTSIPIATGERLFTRWGFREVLEKQAASIVQPDLCHAGGIMECRKIAAMAEVYYAAVAPHNPLGPIALAACLQLDACTPNFLIQEQTTLGEGYLKRPFELKEGYIEVPTDPGLGIELDDKAIEEKRYSGDWHNPQLLHEDGSIADW
ncbi:galactonate dehydratase [Candidatus Bathyarchaeota archaeon]|nr:MAG: galactonate dehydratase [Candidatus Bathyarchaeota archaeon]